MPCIYFTNREDLNYKKQEHIFPAALGGISKLAKGVVSDEANALFSPLELKLVRSSSLEIDRAIFGPGKRGSLAPNKETKSSVAVAINQNDGKVSLSYLQRGTPYTVPCIFFANDGKAIVSLPDSTECDSITLQQFLEKLQLFNEPFSFISDSRIPVGTMLIGYHDNKYYAATNRLCPPLNTIREYISNLNIPQDSISIIHRSSNVSQEFKITESVDASRMYAKVAMNVLAYLCGEDYARRHEFDDIRNWIVSGDCSSESLMFSSLQFVNPPELQRIFTNSEHWCIFVNCKNQLIATVCLYNRHVRQFKFGLIPDNSLAFPFGFICDWKNKIEYSLMEYLENRMGVYYHA